MDNNAQIRAISRLENQRVFVMTAVSEVENGSVGDMTTGRPEDAFAVATNSCERSCAV